MVVTSRLKLPSSGVPLKETEATEESESEAEYELEPTAEATFATAVCRLAKSLFRVFNSLCWD